MKKLFENELQLLITHLRGMMEEVKDAGTLSKEDEVHVIEALAIVFKEIKDLANEYSEVINGIRKDWFRTTYKGANLVYDKNVAETTGLEHGLYLRTTSLALFSMHEMKEMKSREYVMKDVLNALKKLAESSYALEKALAVSA